MDDLLIVTWFILALLLIRTLVAVGNGMSKLHLPSSADYHLVKRVSVLIPARNEANRISKTLEALHYQDYPDMEVWICDDHSTDTTYQIAQEWTVKDKSMHVFKGDPLPLSWSGKNYACHQLAKRATGDYLLFIDADVTLTSDAVRKAVAFADNHDLSLLSVFPQQVMKSWTEYVTVPFMNWILLNLLPLAFVSRFSNPLFAAGNGQFMLFDANGYYHNQWHKIVKSSHVEDILIVREMKKNGFRTMVLLGDHDVFCRMYHGYREALNGFTKNVHEFFLGSRLLMVLFWFSTMIAPWLVL